MNRTTEHSLEHGFQVYQDRTRRLGRTPKYDTLEAWAASPSGVRYAAAHGLGQSPAVAAAQSDNMQALLDLVSGILASQGGALPENMQAILESTRKPPRFVQGHQPLDAPALPPGYTYGRCTYSRRGVEQVTIRIPFDQLAQAVGALHDAQAD